MGDSHSNPLPFHTTPGYQTFYDASSEPSPELNGSTREYFSKEKGFQDDRKNRSHEECERQLERTQGKLRKKESQNESLRIRLFHSLKEAKKYDDAEELFNQTMTGRHPTKSGDRVILDLKHHFAGMLIEQKKFQEAEPISRAVWEKWKQCPGPPSEDSKESHRQLCSILCAVGKHKDAEYLHRGIYQRETMDAWALENGDELCQRLKEQGEFKRAKEMQDEVWKERRKQHSSRDSLAIRSGLRLIGFLEELVATIDHQGGTDAERRLSISHKQAFECEIEVVLRMIWETRRHPEPNTDILNAGHKLGVVLFRQNKFSDAEAILGPVWEGRNQQLGASDVSTITTGSMLGKALYRQGKRETNIRAVQVLRSVWILRQTVMKSDSETISSGEDLAQAYHQIRDWENAEPVYEWILRQKGHNGSFPTHEIENARWNLGQALYQQGKAKDRKAGIVLGELYQQWNASSPNSNLTLQCGQMLAQSLSTQDGRTNDALNFALDVFNGRGASIERGLAYLDSGRLCGSLLLQVQNFAKAERTLKSVWEHQAEGTEERKMRLKCGYLYGQALVNRQKYPDAKRVLDAVAADQEAIHPAGVSEIAETRQLLQQVNRQTKRVRKNSYRRRHI